MNLIPLLQRVTFIALATLTIAYFLYSKGFHDAELESAARELNSLVLYAENIKKASETHDTNQGIIDSLADNARSRVSVQFNSLETPKRNHPGRASRPFPKKLDEEFGRFQESIGILMRRCDQLNIDAIRSNESK